MPLQNPFTFDYYSCYPPSIPQSHDEGEADLPSVFVPPTSIPMTQDRLGEVVAAITGDIKRETRIRAYCISGGSYGGPLILIN